MADRLAQITVGKPFVVMHPRLGRLVVEPTIDPELQARANQLLQAGKDPGAALVAVEATTGRVLVLAGMRRGRGNPQMALSADAPAASLFKVVTAAAALEETKLTPASLMQFVGRPHTLYEFQVKELKRRKANKLSLEKCFAQSNNPVFARLGIYDLGSDVLAQYAKALGFGRPLRAEVPTSASRLVRPVDKFSLGEMACGYNRYTTMSPLHAAVMVASFVGSGHLPEPFLISRVTNAAGQVLYRGGPERGPQVVSPSTRRDMRELFGETVRVGTARRAFSGYRRDKVLKNLEIGGKTGTIRGQDRKYLFEWFAGYGQDPSTKRVVAVASMAMHDKVRYLNPKRLSRQLIREAFRINSLAADDDYQDFKLEKITVIRPGG
ncbi:MAG: hypothetical protein KQJ78_14265 [Deltaproteobacteria bacterium]|nr:hypothetical protein [Deltaproteobacteria bacterium]